MNGHALPRAVTIQQCSSVGDAFDDLARSLESMMDGITRSQSFRSSARHTWDPPVNVYELADRFIVCVELAGVHPDQLDIQVDRGVLHICGRRGKPAIPGVDRNETVRVHLMEIDSGRFHRKIPVPDTLDLDACTASYRSGYVWIELPCKRGPGPDSP